MKHYCSTPGCPREAHYRGRCQECARKLDPLVHVNRSLYTSAAWRAFRLRRLALNPFCQGPLCSQPAREVDHIVPVEQGGAVYSIDNTQCLCTPCHSRKTRAEQHQREPTMEAATITIITGPPCSGKTTYVRDTRRPGDIVIDLDALFAALTYSPEHQHEDAALNEVLRLRDVLLANLKPPAWIIDTGLRARRAELQRMFPTARTITMNTPRETCLDRAAQRPRPAHTAQLIEQWFAGHTVSELQ